MPRRGYIIIEKKDANIKLLAPAERNRCLRVLRVRIFHRVLRRNHRGAQSIIYFLLRVTSCYLGVLRVRNITQGSKLSTFNFQLSTNLTPTLYPKNTATHHPFVLANCPTNVLRCIRHTEMHSLYFQELSSSLMPDLACRG